MGEWLVMRRRPIIAATTIAAVLVGVTSPSSAEARSATVAEAGYQLTTPAVTSSTITFNVPALTCSKKSSAYVTENLELATGTTIEAVSSLIGECTGTSAAYLELADFPAASKGTYLPLTFSAGETVVVKIVDSSSHSSISATVGGTTKSEAGPGFSPTAARTVVVIYPATTTGDIKFSPVDFSAVEFDGSPMSSFSPSKLTAKSGTTTLAKATSIKSGDSFDVKYKA
jgi:hypothetical protein